jgi:Phospholipase_D-nuclease N-terminal
MTGSAIAMPTTAQMIVGLYAYLLPTLLYVLWSTLALWDIGRRTDLRPSGVWIWTFAIFLLPFIGPMGYLIFAGGLLPKRSRIIAVGGGTFAYGLVLLIGTAIGGVS